jgi:hypothetical protein
VNLLDDGPKIPLPEGSLVIETGGTKGRSRSVTRQELYDLLAEGFCIKPEQIVSEYGMCELASQGWDFVRGNQSPQLSQRKFRFPWWVRIGTMMTASDVVSEGIGALTIDDPLRVDLAGVAIQTEDLASISSDGSFHLLGRVPRAPLKGCSLRAESVGHTLEAPAKTRSKAFGPVTQCDVKTLALRAPMARRWLLELLSDREAFARLTEEFQSESIARDALSDLVSGLPSDAQGFVTAATQSTRGHSLPQPWLMIPPASHSVALIQPLTAAFVLGLKIRVRLPAIQHVTPEKTFLARALELAVKASFDIEVLPNTWRLGTDDLEDGEHVLLFGDDDTQAFFEHFAPKRICGFGNAVCVSLTSDREMAQPDHVRQVLKDLLNLRQRGCLSARTVIAFGGDPQPMVTRILSCLPPSFISPTSPTSMAPLQPTPGEVCARSMEYVRFVQHGFHLGPESSRVTVAAKLSSLETLAEDFSSALSRLDLVASVICLPESTSLETVLETLKNLVPLRAVAASDRLYQQLVKPEITGNSPNKFSAVRSGTLGAPSFDGFHLGRRFFAVDE